MRWSALGLIIIFLSSCAALAKESLSLSRNARTFETQHSSLVVKGLAYSCLSVISVPDSLPCNPAMTPLTKKPKFGATGLIANGYSNLTKISELLDGEFKEETVDALFSEGKVIQLDTSADIIFQSQYLSGMYSPIAMRGYSIVRNEANPDVELYAVEESGFTFQTGMEAFNNLYVGVQARLLDRKFIRGRFKLTDLATTQGQELLKPRKQNAIYVEPGLMYLLSFPWKPRVSLFVANLGQLSEEYDDFPTPMEVQGGFGFAPPLWWGELELTLEYRSMNYEESAAQKIRAGALYKYGSMYLSGGVDANGVSGGVFYGLDQVNAGIMYSTTRYINSEEGNYTQTVYVQLGWQL